jgi:hypothetical protein
LGLNAGPFSSPSTQNPTIPVNGHHPAPNPFLHTATNMPNQSAQPEVGKTLKLSKNNATPCAGLTDTTDSNSTLDRCQQAGTHFFGGQ